MSHGREPPNKPDLTTRPSAAKAHSRGFLWATLAIMLAAFIPTVHAALPWVMVIAVNGDVRATDLEATVAPKMPLTGRQSFRLGPQATLTVLTSDGRIIELAGPGDFLLDKGEIKKKTGEARSKKPSDLYKDSRFASQPMVQGGFALRSGPTSQGKDEMTSRPMGKVDCDELEFAWDAGNEKGPFKLTLWDGATALAEFDLPSPHLTLAKGKMPIRPGHAYQWSAEWTGWRSQVRSKGGEFTCMTSAEINRIPTLSEKELNDPAAIAEHALWLESHGMESMAMSYWTRLRALAVKPEQP